MCLCMHGLKNGHIKLENYGNLIGEIKSFGITVANHLATAKFIYPSSTFANLLTI